MEETREPSGKRRATGEEGQGLVEYGFILALVALAVVGALGTFGMGLVPLYQVVINAFPG